MSTEAGQVQLVRRKRHALELAAGAPRAKPGPNQHRIWGTVTADVAERQLAEHAEIAYRRFIADWQASCS